VFVSERDQERVSASDIPSVTTSDSAVLPPRLYVRLSLRDSLLLNVRPCD
jgi:hypothetical protein